MANQIRLPEAAEVKSYFCWLNEQSGCETEIGKILHETDFRWTVEDDKNRAEDGIKWRDRYAEDVGSELNDVQRDRIRKSIHGKTSCYEVILSLADEINAMVNEEEESRTKEFFGILLENLGLNGYDDEEFYYRGEAARTEAGRILQKWLDREYENCDKNCIFPLKKVSQCDRKVSQNDSLWMQMNRWIEANSDENGQFVTENCHTVTVLK